MPRTELFLGNLARDVVRRDIENVFDKYGRLLRCDLKNRISGANCAFIEYDDESKLPFLFFFYKYNSNYLLLFFHLKKEMRK